MTSIPAPRYSAGELTSCQILNDLTAANLRFGLLRQSGLTPHQLVHVRELARCLAVAVATVAAAHADAVEADVPAFPPSTHWRPSVPGVHVPSHDHGNHPAD